MQRWLDRLKAVPGVERDDPRVEIRRAREQVLVVQGEPVMGQNTDDLEFSKATKTSWLPFHRYILRRINSGHLIAAS